MNKYEIVGTIGEGEYGVVLKAKNRETDEIVAIKKFKEDDSDEDSLKLILREIKVFKLMKHPNIVELREAFRKKGKFFLVCEYVEKNLLQIMEEVKYLPPETVRQYLLQTLRGVEYMHSLDLIHRDLKPENLLINGGQELKLCDFGFTRPFGLPLTEYVATRWYRAPELVLNTQYDQSVDIWAAGCIFAEMIDSQPLFPGESDIDQLSLMQRCLGKLTADQQEAFLKKPEFIGMKFSDQSQMEGLERRYYGKVDRDGLELLKKMVKLEPKQRITPAEALKHPYFTRGRGGVGSFAAMPTSTGGSFQRTSEAEPKKQQSNGIAPKNRVTGVNKLKVSVEQPNIGRSRMAQNIKLSNNVSIYNLGRSQSKNSAVVCEQKKAPLQQLIKKDQFQVILQKRPTMTKDQRKPPEEQSEKANYEPKSRAGRRRKAQYVISQEQDDQFAEFEETATKTRRTTVGKKGGKYSNLEECEPNRKLNKAETDKGESERHEYRFAKKVERLEEAALPPRNNFNIIFNNNVFYYKGKK